MALVFHSGLETGDFAEWSSVLGAPAIDDGTLLAPHTGSYHMRCNTIEADAEVVYNLPADTANVSITFYIYIVSVDGDEDTGLCGVILEDNSDTEFTQLYLDTTRHLKVRIGATGGTQLALNTWHRVSMECTWDGIGGNWLTDVWLNGNVEIANDTNHANTIGPKVTVGQIRDATAEIYFDDIAIDISAAGDLGDIRVAAASPSGVGSANAYDTSSGFGNVDEIPANDADFIEDNQGNPVRESYVIPDLADLAGASSGDTINAVSLWIRGDRDGGGATDHMSSMRDNGSYYNSANLAFDSIAWFNTYYALMPDDNGAWSEARFNALEIGAYHSGAQDQRVHCLVAMVAYTPAALQELTATVVGVVSSIQSSVIAGSGNAPLTGGVASVTSSVVTGSIENVVTEQELTAAAVAVTSSVQVATIAGSGDAPLTGASVAVTSSVVVATIVGSGDAPLTGAAISVTSSVQAATIRTSVTILTAAVVSVTSSVQNASIAGDGIAPLTGTVVSVTSSVQQAVVNTTQVLTAAVISVASSVQTAVISGSGDAPLTGTVIGVTSSVQNSAVVGSGIAPLTGTIGAVTSSVVASAIGFIMQASPIPVTSSVVTAAISGSGNAPLTQASVAVTSSVVATSISGSGIAPLTGASVAAASAVQTASIAGVGTAPLTAAIVAATSSVQSASISGTGISPLTAAVVNVLASVAAASISGSGTVNLTEAAIAVSATVNRAVIAGTGVANLTAGYVSVVTSVVSGQAELLWQVLFASPLAVVTSVVGSNVALSWILICEDLGIDPSSLEPTSIPISRLEITEVESSRQPLCRPKRRYT